MTDVGIDNASVKVVVVIVAVKRAASSFPRLAGRATTAIWRPGGVVVVLAQLKTIDHSERLLAQIVEYCDRLRAHETPGRRRPGG